MASIICAEDDEWIRLLYKSILEKRYRNLRILDNGSDVLEAFKAEPADLLIADINMPGLSGLDLCRAIRRDLNNHNVSIIIVSSQNTEDDIVNGFLAGADDYLVKPINHCELLAKISIVLNKKMTNVTKLLGVFPGTIFAGRYEIIHKLGKGSFSNVYYAKDVSLSPTREVALKIFDLPLLRLSDQKFMALFLREAYGLSKLDYPNIVKLYDFGTANFYYLAMEYLKGQTLQEIIEKTGPIAEDDAQVIAYEITKILMYLETFHLVHRDIKPINIMVTETGMIKLLDFGLARSVNEETITYDNVFKGTPQFAAPESIYSDEAIDIQSDIYSLGATLYYLVTQVPPFSGDSPMEILKNRFNETPKPIREYNPVLKPEFADLIDRMLSQEKADRPALAEIIEILKHLQRP